MFKRGKALPEAPADDRWIELRRRLQDLPQDPVPRSHPRNWLFRMKRTADMVGHASYGGSRFFRRVNPYPKPFMHMRFRAADGVQIAAWLGPQHDPERPSPFGLVIVPGMFSTKDDSIHKRRTIHLWRHWKVPVIVIDTRAFGESAGIATAGWKEALDIIGAAQMLASQTGVTRVGVIAESLGGAAALNALAHDSAGGQDLLAGGVLTWSAFLDAKDAVQYISDRPTRDDPFFASWAGFRRMLSYRTKGAYERFDLYLADAAEVNGLQGLDEILDLANPKWKVSMMHQPVLAVHATDDPVVPVRHARRLDRYARDYPNIQSMVVEWGGHTGFEAMDPWWYWEVTRLFFGEVNSMKFPNLADVPRRRVSEPVQRTSR